MEISNKVRYTFKYQSKSNSESSSWNKYTVSVLMGTNFEDCYRQYLRDTAGVESVLLKVESDTELNSNLKKRVKG